MRFYFPIVIASCALLPLLGCVARPAPPKLDRQQVKLEGASYAERRIDTLIEDRSRLLDLEYAIATRAAVRCGDVGWSHPGLLFATAENFEDDVIRKDIEARFGRGAETVIVHIVPGSGAARVDLRIGDRLLSIDDVEVERVDEVIQHLIRHRDQRSFELRVRRGDEELERKVEFDSACPVVISADVNHLLVTRRTNRLVIDVPLGLAVAIDDDDLLASIIGHEMAHALFDHDGESPLERELRADREGLLLSARAGFSPEGLPGYWTEVAEAYPWLIGPKVEISPNDSRTKSRPIDHQIQFDHYHIGERLPAMREQVDRIVERFRELEAQEATASQSPAEGTP